MSSLPGLKKRRETRSKLQDMRPSPPRPCPVFCNGETYLLTLSLPILSVSLCVWSSGSPRCGRTYLHSIPPILSWLVGQGYPTQRRTPNEYLPRPVPWHWRRRPRVGAPPLFPRTSSTHNRIWWKNGRCRCQSHGSDGTQVCKRFGWRDTSSLDI